MTRFRFLGLVGMVGLVLGLSSCGNVVNEPAAEEPGLETQEIFDATVFVSILRVNGSSGAGKCADVPRYTKRVGADLIQYDCNDQENQLFLFERVGDEILSYTIKSLVSGLCMSVSSTEKLGGNPVIEQTACTGAPNQQFGIITVSVEDVGQFGIEAGRNSGRCLAVNDRSRQNRAKLVAVDCGFGDSALPIARDNRWNLSNYDPAFTTEMIYSMDGKCADVPRFSEREGTDLIVYRCNGQTNQQWEFFKVGSDSEVDAGEFFIKSTSSGLCMTLSGTVLDRDRVIEQRQCTANDDQRFEIIGASGPGFSVVLSIDELFDCLGVGPSPFAEGFRRTQERDKLIPYPCLPEKTNEPRWELPGGLDAFLKSLGSSGSEMETG